MDRERIEVVITSGIRWSNFQWFLLGFYELARAGEIELKFKLPIRQKLCNFLPSPFLCRKLSHFFRRSDHDDNFNLRGYMVYQDGKVKHFVLDSQDSPFIFDHNDLVHADCYFKMQCPKNLDAPDFALTPKVHAPWTDAHYIRGGSGPRRPLKDFASLRHKVHPLMIGPRRLSLSCSYRTLRKAYDNFITARQVEKRGRLMCYFGNAKGPVPLPVTGEIDWNQESQIMARYADKLNHPNEKRAKAAQYIRDCQEYVTDARVISRGNSDISNKKQGICQRLCSRICPRFSSSRQQISNNDSIPYEMFTQHVAGFDYNFNVSGYRLSIPNRFIESFMVGTEILTDKLSIRWYRPFASYEVKETVPMGYLPDNEVDWQQFQRDLATLPHTDKRKIISSFEEKWAPEVVARYIIDTVQGA